ncbi:MAG: hypothetical protein V6Z81_01705 [Parvularculales bacterium]
MDWLIWHINFAAHNILGFMPIVAIVYGLFFVLRRKFSKLPDPFIFGALTFLMCLFTILSIPKYIFEYKIVSMYKHLGKYKLGNEARWGNLSEPLTLFSTPIGLFHFISPIPEVVVGYEKTGHVIHIVRISTDMMKHLLFR